MVNLEEHSTFYEQKAADIHFMYNAGGNASAAQGQYQEQLS